MAEAGTGEGRGIMKRTDHPHPSADFSHDGRSRIQGRKQESGDRPGDRSQGQNRKRASLELQPYSVQLETVLTSFRPDQFTNWLFRAVTLGTISPDQAKSALCVHLWASVKGLSESEIGRVLSQTVAFYRWGFSPSQINSPIMLMFDAVAHLYPILVRAAHIVSDGLPLSNLSSVGKAWKWMLEAMFDRDRDIQYYHSLLRG